MGLYFFLKRFYFNKHKWGGNSVVFGGLDNSLYMCIIEYKYNSLSFTLIKRIFWDSVYYDTP